MTASDSTISLFGMMSLFYRTVVTLNMAKSEGLYSCLIKRMKDRNSALVTLGKVDIDIPQHPGVLHGMVSRSSKRLSTTLQEFIRPASKSRY